MRWNQRLLISGLFLFSGAAALVYQVVWMRKLALIFGASQPAVSIVLSAFMAGLALGGVAGGRIAERVRRPLRSYALLEAGVALAALVLPFLLDLVQRVYVAAAMRSEEVTTSINVMRAGLAFFVLVLPTLFMGATLPVLVRAVVRRFAEFDARLAWLYGLNTAGAVLGAAAAGFLLLPQLGVRNTQALAIAANLCIALVAWIADRRAAATGDAARRGTAEAAPGADAPPAIESLATRRALQLAFFATFVTGMCALALEVLWSRGITVATGSTTYSFTIMLCAFLVGITLGSALHGVLPLRRVSEVVQLGVVLACIGITGAAVSQAIPRLPQLAVDLNLRFHGGSQGIRGVSTLLLSFTVMLVPAVFMGAAFPLAGRAWARLQTGFGRSVGDLVAVNTLGAILGPLLAGFVLVPQLGLQRAMLLVCGLELAYGLLLLAVALAPRARSAALIVSLLAVAVPFALPRGLPRWDLHTLGAFQNNVTLGTTDERGRTDVRAQLLGAQVLYYAEGRGSTVSVVESQGNRAVLINGRSVATDNQTDLQHEALLGHLPVLLHPSPRDVLVIGLGAGLTLGGVTAHPDIRKITLVEIEPAVLGAARVFEDLNGAALDDPRLRIVVQDGRNHLRTSPTNYDVITADPIHPWDYGSTYLYTTEYYELARSRLAPGGIMCQWMPIYEVSDANLRSIVATFAGVFPHTLLFQTTFDAVIIGALEPIRVDWERLGARLRPPEVARQLGRIGLQDAGSFLAEFTMGEAEVARYSARATLNTDDNLYLEFSSPFSIGNRGGGENIVRIDQQRVSAAALVGGATAPPPETFEELANAKRGTVLATLMLEDVVQAPTWEKWNEAVELLQQVLATTPAYARAQVLLAEALTGRGRAEVAAADLAAAEASFTAAVAAAPQSAAAYFELGSLLLSQGRAADAVEPLQRTLSLRPRYPRAHLLAGVALSALGRLDAAATELARAVTLEPQGVEARLQLAVLEMRRGRMASASDHFALVLERDPGQTAARLNLSLVLTAMKRHAESAQVLRRGLKLQPKNAEIAARLAWLLATTPDAAVRNGAEAVVLAQQALDAAPAPGRWMILAAALAADAQFEAAIEAGQRAESLATAAQDAQLAAEVRMHLRQYSQRAALRL